MSKINTSHTHSINPLFLSNPPPSTLHLTMATNNVDPYMHTDSHISTQTSRSVETPELAEVTGLRGSNSAGMQISWPSEQTARRRETTVSRRRVEGEGAPRHHMTHSGSGSRILSGNGGMLNSDTGSRLPSMNKSRPISEILTSGPTNGREGTKVSHKQKGRSARLEARSREATSAQGVPVDGEP